MRAFFLAILLMFSTPLMAIDECFTGSWYDPITNDGRGIDIQVMDTMVVGYYYTWYDNRRQLFILQGANDLKDGVALEGLHSGIKNGKSSVRHAGTAEIMVSNNDTIIFTHVWKYDWLRENSPIPWCFVECDKQYRYKRLTQPIPCE